MIRTDFSNDTIHVTAGENNIWKPNCGDRNWRVLKTDKDIANLDACELNKVCKVC